MFRNENAVCEHGFSLYTYGPPLLRKEQEATEALRTIAVGMIELKG